MLNGGISQLQARIMKRMRDRELYDGLTPRQKQVYHLIVKQALGNQEIADSLHLKRSWVEKLCTKIYRRTGLVSRAELIANARDGPYEFNEADKQLIEDLGKTTGDDKDYLEFLVECSPNEFQKQVEEIKAKGGCSYTDSYYLKGLLKRTVEHKYTIRESKDGCVIENVERIYTNFDPTCTTFSSLLRQEHLPTRYYCDVCNKDVEEDWDACLFCGERL